MFPYPEGRLGAHTSPKETIGVQDQNSPVHDASLEDMASYMMLWHSHAQQPNVKCASVFDAVAVASSITTLVANAYWSGGCGIRKFGENLVAHRIGCCGTRKFDKNLVANAHRFLMMWHSQVR